MLYSQPFTFDKKSNKESIVENLAVREKQLQYIWKHETTKTHLYHRQYSADTL